MSPEALLQEGVLRPDGGWSVFVCCVLLNQTRGAQAGPVIRRLLRTWRLPEDVAAAGPELEELLRPLGLWRVRAAGLRRAAADWLRIDSRVTPPSAGEVLTVRGAGRYAADAHCIFVLRRDPGEGVTDKELLRYLRWARSPGGPFCAAPRPSPSEPPPLPPIVPPPSVAEDQV